MVNKEIVADSIVEFLRKKDFKFIKQIGQGSIGHTILLEDETIDEKFICKKYAPYYVEHQQLFFTNFVHEIKLLHLLYHKNVVRVFNYYLYPEQWTGYILMEYINGVNISEYLTCNPEGLNDIFEQTISGFMHLEEGGILHRDIRPDNILVSHLGVVKIIDLGFGKKIQFDGDEIKSVSLNWRYSSPNEFEEKIYDWRSEVYFVGKLFDQIINENNIQTFAYPNILKQMIKMDYNTRIPSFFEVERMIIAGDGKGITFSKNDKESFQQFATSLVSILVKIERSTEYLKDVDLIITKLDEAYRNCMLELNVQNPLSITQCLLRGQYTYRNKNYLMTVNILFNFVRLLKSGGLDKKRVVIANLWQRMDAIERYDDIVDDLPF